MSRSAFPAIFLILPALVLLACPAPASAAISVVGGLTRAVVVQPGKEYRGTIVVKSISDQPEEIRAYQTDYLFHAEGDASYGEAGKAPRSNAAWISFSPSRSKIAPRQSINLHYVIAVPDRSDLSGTYWSMLMVEAVPAEAAQAGEQSRKTPRLAIRQVIRYGIQMITQVGKTGSAKLSFQTKLLKENGKALLQIDLDNQGERWLRPSLWVELYDQEGSLMGRFEAGRKRVFPATSTRSKVDLSDVPEGAYKALVVADAGGGDVFGATYTLRLEERPPGEVAGHATTEPQ